MITGALQEARSAWPGVPFVVYPNTGDTWQSGSGWAAAGAGAGSALLELVPDWVKLGAVVVGGCCRVDAELLPGIQKMMVRGIAAAS